MNDVSRNQSASEQFRAYTGLDKTRETKDSDEPFVPGPERELDAEPRYEETAEDPL